MLDQRTPKGRTSEMQPGELPVQPYVPTKYTGPKMSELKDNLEVLILLRNDEVALTEEAEQFAAACEAGRAARGYYPRLALALNAGKKYHKAVRHYHEQLEGYKP